MSKIVQVGNMDEWVRKKQAELAQSEVDRYLALDEYKVEVKQKQKKESE